MSDKKFMMEYEDEGRYCFGFAQEKTLYKGKTKYQDIELCKTKLFGNTLKLDGFFQTSEGEEWFYHETLTHPALMAHPNPKRVLVIGGGDAGIAREVLQHSTVEKVTVAELDGGVIEFSKKYLKKISGGAFASKRAEFLVCDGKKYIEESKEKFDVILIDLTDPIGPARPLFEVPFYKTVKAHLNKNGIVALQSEPPIFKPKVFSWVNGNLRKAFKNVFPYLNYIPLYGTMWSFTFASADVDPRKITAQILHKRMKDRGVKNLKWYTPEIHIGLFNLPPYVQKLIKK